VHDHASYRCPDCRETLLSTLVPYREHDELGALYTEAFYCPNHLNHGIPVPCPNCERPVLSRSEHYTSRAGVLGSGRYTCVKPAAVKRIVDALGFGEPDPR